jgi:hypothetical protein
MTLSILDNIEHWRARAKAARLVANHLDDPVAKAAMLTIAEQYERIAEQAQVRSHDEAPTASESQDGSAAEEPRRPAENLRRSRRRQSQGIARALEPARELAHRSRSARARPRCLPFRD